MLTTSEALVAGSALGAAFGTMFFLGGVLVIAFYVLLIIADWKIFTKAGEKGWKSLIPFYNMYITFKLFWETKWFWFTLVGLIVLGLLQGIMNGSSNGSTIAVVSAILVLAVAIFLIYVGIKLCYRLAKSFGHGVGYTVGLIFLPNIFTLILGFNKDKYKKIKD